MNCDSVFFHPDTCFGEITVDTQKECFTNKHIKRRCALHCNPLLFMTLVVFFFYVSKMFAESSVNE